VKDTHGHERDSRRPHSISARPYPDESFIGYVFRLAKLRHMPTAYKLLPMAHPFTNRPNAAALALLATDARVPISELERITWGPLNSTIGRFRGLELPLTVFDRRGSADRRVCPECLADAAYYRAIWDLTFVAACPIHRRLLVDDCTNCGRPLRWNGGELARCGYCSHDLTRVPSSSITEDDARGTETVFGLLGDMRFAGQAAHARTLAPFRDLQDRWIVEFLFRAGLEIIGARPKLFSMEQPNELAWEAHIALTRGLDVAEAWPEAFIAMMDRMRQRRTDFQTLTLKFSVGAVERWLARLPPDQGLEIRRVAEEYRRGFVK